MSPPLYANPPALIILSSLRPASEGASRLPQCQLKIIANVLNQMEIHPPSALHVSYL